MFIVTHFFSIFCCYFTSPNIWIKGQILKEPNFLYELHLEKRDTYIQKRLVKKSNGEIRKDDLMNRV